MAEQMVVCFIFPLGYIGYHMSQLGLLFIFQKLLNPGNSMHQK
jgi:hypothetical protein